MTLEQTCQRLETVEQEKSDLENEINHEHQVNQSLSDQIEEITRLAEELQSQTVSAGHENADLIQQNEALETSGKQLELKIGEMLNESHYDKQIITQLRDKISSLKRKRVHSR